MLDTTILPGIDAAKFNQNQYKLGYLQRLIEAGYIHDDGELMQANQAIDGSYKTFSIVSDWANREKAYG